MAPPTATPGSALASRHKICGLPVTVNESVLVGMEAYGYTLSRKTKARWRCCSSANCGR